MGTPHTRVASAAAPHLTPNAGAGGHLAALTSYSDLPRLLPELAGGPGRRLSWDPSHMHMPWSDASQRYQTPGALRLLVLMNRTRLSTLGQEFVGTKSWRIPRQPRSAAAGKGQAGGGACNLVPSGAEARREGAAKATGRANYPQQKAHSSPRARRLPEMVGLSVQK